MGEVVVGSDGAGPPPSELWQVVINMEATKTTRGGWAGGQAIRLYSATCGSTVGWRSTYRPAQSNSYHLCGVACVQCADVGIKLGVRRE